jgi:hypothetical protein
MSMDDEDFPTASGWDGLARRRSPIGKAAGDWGAVEPIERFLLIL